MNTDIQKLIAEITKEVINRANASGSVTSVDRSVCNTHEMRSSVSIGRGSAYDLGPYADEMRKMMAERGSLPIAGRRKETSDPVQSSVSFHHGSAYDYGTRL